MPRELVDAFVGESRASFARLFGNDVAGNPDYTSVVNDRHLARIHELLADAKSKGGRVIPCATYEASRHRRMPMHIVTGCTADMRVMREELFGSILPVVACDTLDDAIAFINRGERSLAKA
ncbi:aldehyde dehydrogenase family protein [Bradyrhizobium sp. WD16]|uniref:aldehyde dehydrogenase family protein n=1 Tax=Bradyrhizobium sp. WD16 TaxID=1521768 RepID=UPI0020A2934B|nr:aldehyde dehydrogenase family protein [Bradyrhizobium sp. WD16]